MCFNVLLSADFSWQAGKFLHGKITAAVKKAG
jgi:hypothetical protein